VGFSRGGFTVRCLAAFISQVGLLRRISLPLLATLFELWKNDGSSKGSEVLLKLVKSLRDEKLLKDVGIKFLGEWDTVSAMGLPFGQIADREFAFVKDEVPSRVEYAYHAVALNEQRRQFEPMLYMKAEPKSTVRQCGFLGCHSDVGGGNEDAGLSTICLLWMVAGISDACGAQFDDRALLQVLPLIMKPKMEPSGMFQTAWQRATTLVKPREVCGTANAILRPGGTYTTIRSQGKCI
jgi:uncharacterized protein (DUF2235 family)